MQALFDQYVPHKLRDYQENAIVATQRWWSEGKIPLIWIATGLGKTTVIAELLRRTIQPTTQRALVIAHTDEIVSQAHDRVQNQFGGALQEHFTDSYAPGLGIVMGDRNDEDSRIVCASRQSLHPARLQRVLKHGAFDIVVIDEAHHAQSANTYGAIVKSIRAVNPGVKIVGFTATPTRSDGGALDEIFTGIAFQYGIVEGIEAGYLVPARRIAIHTAVSLKGIKKTAGDYNQQQLTNVLDAANWDEFCARIYQEQIAPTNRPTIAFFPSVSMSQRFAKLLQQQGVNAVHIDGDTLKDDRRAALAKFPGEIKVISNVAVFTEGIDIPAIAAILLARPTQSEGLFTQMVGRMLRPFPGKTDGLLVDVAGVDTRALEAANMIGKLVPCPACGVERYFKIMTCPACGFTVKPVIVHKHDQDADDDEQDDGKPFVIPDRIIDRYYVSYENLFANAFAAWYTGDDGFSSSTISFSKGALIIIPPLMDNDYRLAVVPSNPNEKVELVGRNDDLASLMLEADTYIKTTGEKVAAGREAEWRKLPVTPGQVTTLKGLGVADGDKLTRGAASQLLTHKFAVKRMLKELHL